MSNDNVSKLLQPGSFKVTLTDILREGARILLAQAVEAEVAGFLDQFSDLKTADGYQRIVRHGHLPERQVMTGIGAVAVRQPRVRNQGAAADGVLGVCKALGEIWLKTVAQRCWVHKTANVLTRCPRASKQRIDHRASSWNRYCGSNLKHKDDRHFRGEQLSAFIRDRSDSE